MSLARLQEQELREFREELGRLEGANDPCSRHLQQAHQGQQHGTTRRERLLSEGDGTPLAEWLARPARLPTQQGGGFKGPGGDEERWQAWLNETY
jgi:hypothetical protein